MKIQIDLNEILQDEYGSTENLAQSIERQIIEQVRKDIDSNLKKEVSHKISSYIDERAKVEIDSYMPKFIPELLDSEYIPTNRYGEREKVTTFRKELIKKIQEEMKYEPKDSYGRGSENAFTIAVKSMLEVKMDEFKKQFNSIVDKEFTKKTVELVTTELRKKFGI